MRDITDLTEMQGKFVAAYVSGPGTCGNATQAAVAAGYSPHSAREQGWQLLHLPHIMAAIRVEQHRRFQEGATVGLRVLTEIMDDPTASNRDRVSAARTVLEGAGFIGRRRLELEGEKDKPLNEMTRAELSAFIEAERKAIRELERAAAENDGKLIDITPEGADEDQPDPIIEAAGEFVAAAIENRPPRITAVLVR